MIRVKIANDWTKTLKFINNCVEINMKNLNKYGAEGVKLLQQHTPVDTGKTANAWSYVITKKSEYVELAFVNDNVVNNVPIAIILQYGHATRNGGYVQGVDYINPALKALFTKMAEEAWKEVIG